MRIDSITPDDVMRVARQYLEDRDPTVAAIGPLDEFPGSKTFFYFSSSNVFDVDYNMTRSWTYWHRW
jgi:hypothetical protein